MTTLFSGLIWLWFGAELFLGLRRRANRPGDRAADRGSEKVLWLVMASSFLLAGVAQLTAVARLPWPMTSRLVAASILIVAGMAIRWHSIYALGRFFTTNVALREGHRIVDAGLYRWLRHPSYAGFLIICLGGGIGLGNWLSLALCTVVPAVVFGYRIRVEERALLDAFGDEYRRYAARTRRLVPWLY